MAIEHIFISSAINVVAAIGIFTVFYLIAYKEKNWFWQQVWTMAILLMLLYTFSIERFAWDSVFVSAALGDLSVAIIFGIIAMLSLLFAYLAIGLLYHVLRDIYERFVGEGKYKHG